MTDALPAEVRDLLAAVVEALDVPMPDIADDARHEHRTVLIRRTSDVRIVLQSLLEAPTADLRALATDAGVIRQWTADTPVTYPVFQPAPSCARCRRPFDPSDARFDGHGQHGDSPWCRSCIDLCHDSEIADHACVICDPSRRGGEGR